MSERKREAWLTVCTLMIVVPLIFLFCAATAHAADLTPVSTFSEWNPWIVGMGAVIVVLVVLVELARRGHLGGASATVNAAVATSMADALKLLSTAFGDLGAALLKAHGTIDALAAAKAPPPPQAPVTPAAATPSGFVLPAKK